VVVCRLPRMQNTLENRFIVSNFRSHSQAKQQAGVLMPRGRSVLLRGRDVNYV
jgi:hypothetical protein